jgi:hypothetical protein
MTPNTPQNSDSPLDTRVHLSRDERRRTRPGGAGQVPDRLVQDSRSRLPVARIVTGSTGDRGQATVRSRAAADGRLSRTRRSLAFYAFGLILAATLTCLLVTVHRVLQSGRDDAIYAHRIARLRAATSTRRQRSRHICSVCPQNNGSARSVGPLGGGRVRLGHRDHRRDTSCADALHRRPNGSPALSAATPQNSEGVNRWQSSPRPRKESR